MALHTPRRKGPSPADAEALALAAFSFIAAEPERLGTFLEFTGLTPATVRAAASSPGFLPAVLDHLLGNEALLLDFAAEHGADPAAIYAARAVMPGVRWDALP
jgi:hypothetical protein